MEDLWCEGVFKNMFPKIWFSIFLVVSAFFLLFGASKCQQQQQQQSLVIDNYDYNFKGEIICIYNEPFFKKKIFEFIKLPINAIPENAQK